MQLFSNIEDYKFQEHERFSHWNCHQWNIWTYRYSQKLYAWLTRNYFWSTLEAFHSLISSPIYYINCAISTEFLCKHRFHWCNDQCDWAALPSMVGTQLKPRGVGLGGAVQWIERRLPEYSLELHYDIMPHYHSQPPLYLEQRLLHALVLVTNERLFCEPYIS